MLKILTKNFSKENIKIFKKKYDLIKCSVKEWEDMHDGKGIKLPISMLDSCHCEEDHIEVRCIHCGSPVFKFTCFDRLRCFINEDGTNNIIDTIKEGASPYVCLGCDKKITKEIENEY